MIDKEKLLNAITDDIVVAMMKENGSPLFKVSIDQKTGQKCFWFRTICHGGNSHKLCYFTKSKDFYCYTNCGRMDFFELIKRVKNISDGKFYEVLKYVADKVGGDFNVGKDLSLDDGLRQKIARLEDYNTYIANSSRSEINNFYDPSILNYFDENTFYEGWLNENISIEVMQQFGIRWYDYGDSIIIPHYNADGKLVGIRRRSLKPEDSNRKYMPLFIGGKSYAHALGSNLYGLNINKEAIRKQGRAIIVEAEKSVLMSNTYFGSDSIAVATCGFNVSTWQIRALCELGVGEVFLGFDKDFDPLVSKSDDPEYKRYREKLLSIGNRMSQDFKVTILTDRDVSDSYKLKLKDSPFDKGKKVFLEIYNTSSLNAVNRVHTNGSNIVF